MPGTLPDWCARPWNMTCLEIRNYEIMKMEIGNWKLRNYLPRLRWAVRPFSHLQISIFKFLISIFIISCFPDGAFAQNQTDSLRALISHAPEDTAKVWLYRDLYKVFQGQSKLDEMISVAKKGLVLSRQLDYPKGNDYMIFYLATALDMAGRGGEAIPLYEEGVRLNQKNGNLSSEADYTVNLGVAYHYRGDFEEALKYYLRAHEILTKLDSKERLGKVLNNIGIIYQSQEKYGRAEEIYLESFQLKKEAGDSMGMAASLQNLGAVYSQSNDLEKAVEHLKRGRGIYQKLNRPEDVASCFTSLGEIYTRAGKPARSKAAYEQAWAYFEDHPEDGFTAKTLHGLGQAAIREKDYGRAINFLKKGLAMDRQFGQKENALAILKDLGTALNGAGKNAEAYAVAREAYALRDSLTEEKRLSLLEEMQAKFDVRQKDNELKISQLELGQRTRQRNFSIFGAAGLLLLAGSVFFGLRARMKANKKIAEQESEIQNVRIRQLEGEKKTAALTSMLEGEERERSRIAHDLHDSLGGLLTSVKSHFNSLEKPAGKQAVFEKTNHLIDEACGEVRRISHNMMPRALSLSGLSGAVEDLAQNIRQQGLDCELETFGMEDLVLPQAKAVNIYRIIQELTNNVLKHADAKNLLLQIIHRDGELSILVEDDGKGFDVEKAFRQKGLGLSSIASRIELLQAHINWDSVPGEGTTVSVRQSF